METLPPEIILNYIIPNFYNSLLDTKSLLALKATSKFFYNLLESEEQYILKHYSFFKHREFYIPEWFDTINELSIYQCNFFFPSWILNEIPNFQNIPIENDFNKTKYLITRGIHLFYPFIKIKLDNEQSIIIFSSANYSYKNDWLINPNNPKIIFEKDKKRIINVIKDLLPKNYYKTK